MQIRAAPAAQGLRVDLAAGTCVPRVRPRGCPRGRRRGRRRGQPRGQSMSCRRRRVQQAVRMAWLRESAAAAHVPRAVHHRVSHDLSRAQALPRCRHKLSLPCCGARARTRGTRHCELAHSSSPRPRCATLRPWQAPVIVLRRSRPDTTEPDAHGCVAPPRQIAPRADLSATRDAVGTGGVIRAASKA